MKLYTLTLNPTLDASGHVKRIILDEKNSLSSVRIDPGGNGINAARIARRLGQNPVALGFAGGAVGEELSALLKEESIRTDFVSVAQPTRINFTVTNSDNHHQTRLSFPGPQISTFEKLKLRRKISALKGPSLLVIGGSLPPGFHVRDLAELIHIAQKRKVGVILDIRSEDLNKLIKKKFQRWVLIKPNLHEFQEMIGTKTKSPSHLVQKSQALLKKVDVICISLGSQGALVITAKKSWLFKSPKVKSLGSVGAGDSFVGSLAASLADLGSTIWNDFSEETIIEIFKRAVAAGAATASEPGTSLGKASQIRRLEKKVTVTEIP